MKKIKINTSIFESRDCLSMREINTYLEDQASEEERFSIENHLLDCELCSAVVKGYSKSDPIKTKHDLSEINTMLQKEFSQEQEAVKLKKEVEKREQEIPVENSNRAKQIRIDNRRGRINWSIAAIGIALLGFALWTYSNRPSQQDLYASYFEPYTKGLIATRSESGGNASMITQGLEKYESGDFQEALLLLEKGLAIHPENGQANFYAGLAALEGNDLSKAVQFLKRCRINYGQYYGSATWYLAMTYLKQGEQELAIETLKGLSEKDAPYFVKSLRLLREIQQK